MTVLRHALFGNDFHQTPVSIIFSEKCAKFFSGFVGGERQVEHNTTRTRNNHCLHLSFFSLRVLLELRTVLLNRDSAGMGFFVHCRECGKATAVSVLLRGGPWR